MAQAAVSISGRLVEGQTLKAEGFGLTGLQWQAWVNGAWVNVGSPGSQTFVIPGGASGTTYRLVGTTATGTVVSAATGAVTVDSKQRGYAPVLTSTTTAILRPEQGGPGLVFDVLAFSDADKANYGNGSLIVLNSNSLASGGDGRDVLSIRFAGTAAGQFGYNAATRDILYYATSGTPTVIGRLDAALDGNGGDLKVVFTANATKEIVDKLVDNIQFANNDDSPELSRILTLRITDPTGASAQQVRYVNITPAADAPVFGAGASFTVDENQTAVGALTATDPDREAGAPQGISFSLAAGAGGTDNGRFEIDAATGELRFIAPPNYEDPAHAPGYSLRVRATDSEGSVTEQVVLVTVRNVNDAPVAQALSGSTPEMTQIEFTPVFTDGDVGDSHTLTADGSGLLGLLLVENGRIYYGAGPALRYLAAGETLQETFSYTVTDAAGLSSTASVTVTVTGTNDVPVISGVSTGQVREDVAVQDGKLVATGALAISDFDAGQSQFVARSSVAGSNGYGTFNIDAAGAWSYEAGNGSAAVQALRAGQSVTDSFTVTSLDGTASRVVTVTLAGSNDAPQALPGSGSVTEAGHLDNGDPAPGTPMVQGDVVALDPDAGTALQWSGTADGAFGRFVIDAATGHWVYTLDNARAATNALREGDVRTETFTTTVSDGQGGTTQTDVTITVNGANDAPQLGDFSRTWGEVQEPVSGRGRRTTGQGYMQGAALHDGYLLYLSYEDDRSIVESIGPDGARVASFGDAGRVVLQGSPAAFAVDGQGRVVTISNPNGQWRIERYTPGGELDTSFGVAGAVVMDLLPGYEDTPRGLHIDASGRIVIETHATRVAIPYWTNSLGFVRLDADGSLDPAFGEGGQLILDTNPVASSSQFEAMLDASGRLVLWGETWTEWGPNDELVVMRFDASGALDTSFGTNGRLALNVPNFEWSSDLVEGADGSLTLAWADRSSGPGSIRLLRLTPEGTLDTTFGQGGILDTGLAGEQVDLAVDGAGNLLVGYGGSDGDIHVARFNAAGERDGSFGVSGLATANFGDIESADRTFVGPDGRIWVVGHQSGPPNHWTSLVAAFNPDGTPDAGFGDPMTVTTSGQLLATDADANSVLHWLGGGTGTYGDLTLNDDGSWIYVLDASRPATLGLGVGDWAFDTFSVALTDDVGGTSIHQIQIAVTGSYNGA